MGAKLIKVLAKGWFLSLITSLLVVVALEFSSAAKPTPEPCPAGTVPIQGHKCLLALTGDRTLSSTIVLGSRMILDCQGHSLIPSVVGTVDDATTPTNEFTPSQPDLAVFLNGTVDAKIQNCVIGTEDAKFDFGVYALDSAKNAIKHNTIHVRTVGIHIINASNNKISENEIDYGSELGRGIHLQGNSDFNIVEGNLVTSTGDDETSFDPATGRVNVAGIIRGEPGTFTPPLTAGGPDAAIMSLSPFYDLLNLKINGEVIQVPRMVGDNPDGNIIDSNVTRQEKLTNLSTRQIGIFIAFGTRDSIITHNEASGGRYGIFNAGEAAVGNIKILPGNCSLSGEYCIAGSVVDCPSGAGTCNGETSINIDGRNFDNLMEENVLSGPYSLNTSAGQNGGGPGGSAIQVQNNNVNAIVRDNTITGDLASNSIPVGIGLTGKALETSSVERNRVSGATTGLGLIQSQGGIAPNTANFFGTPVTLNDFVGNGMNVKSTRNQPPLAPQPYTLATELSVDDQGNVCGPGSSNCRGNYWGHICDESDGFIEFGLPGADSDDADTVDSNAFGEAVALQDPVSASVCPGNE